MRNYFSECGQDIFALILNNNCYNGTFLEIGCNDQKISSNCFLLDKHYNWKGISIDIDEYDFTERKNSIFIKKDCTKLNFKDILEINNFPKIINYLSLDLDVINGSTILTLENLAKIFNTYKFKVITFEHDIYTGNHHNTRERSRKIFKDNGYHLLFSDVLTKGIVSNNDKFEDWYIKLELINKDILNLINNHFKNNDSIHGKTIIMSLENLIK